MRKLFWFAAVLAAFALVAPDLEAARQAPRPVPVPPDDIVHTFPSTVVDDVYELPTKIVTIRQQREQWLSIVRQELGGGPEVNAFIEALRYQLEQNMTQGINRMIETGNPAVFGMATLTYPASSSYAAMSTNSQEGELYGPPCPFEEECPEEPEMDCYPRDAYGPPPPGMDWCPPDDPPGGDDDFCIEFPSLCDELGPLTGGGCGGFGQDNPTWDLFPPSVGYDFGNGWSIKGELFFGDPPGGLIEDHTGGIQGGAMVTITFGF